MQFEQNGKSTIQNCTTKSTNESTINTHGDCLDKRGSSTAELLHGEHGLITADRYRDYTSPNRDSPAATLSEPSTVMLKQGGERENWDEDGKECKDPAGNRDEHGLWRGSKSLRISKQAEDRLPSSEMNGKASDEEQEDSSHKINPLGLHLLASPERGRGVFTDKEIRANTLIEESPVLVLSRDEWEKGFMDKTILGSYGFCWSGGGMGIGLGMGQ